MSDEVVQEFRKLSTDQLNKANQRHGDLVAKLEEQKAELRERVKAQRAEYKVSCVTSRNEALELLCTVSEVESKKLGRELSCEQVKAAAFGAKELLSEERVHNLVTEN